MVVCPELSEVFSVAGAGIANGLVGLGDGAGPEGGGMANTG